MTNREATQRFDGYTHSAYINKLFWIAGSFDSKELEDMLNEMEDEDYKMCLPLIAKSQYFEEYKADNEIKQALIDHNYFGLIAEIYHPRCYNFSKDNKGKVTSCSVSMGSCRVSYAYAENLKDLMKEIEKNSELMYQAYVLDDSK